MFKSKTVGHITLLIALGCLVSQAWAKPVHEKKHKAHPIGEPASKGSPTPASIGIDTLALYSGKSLSLGKSASITGSVAGVNSVSLSTSAGAGDIYSGGTVYLGNSSNATANIWANGKVSLDGKSRVEGNVTTQGKYWKDKKATVAGQVTLGGDAELLVLPSMDTAPGSGTLGATSIWEGHNSTTDLASGSYNTVGFGHNATLNLSAGTYTMKSFWMDKEGSVNVDTSLGDVILNVHRGFSVGRDVTFNTLGDGDLFVNVFDKDVWLDNNAKMDATVRVFKGKFATGKDVALTGTFHASDNISLGQGSQVTYGGAGGSAVPEPATIALLACGGAMCILRKYRRK